jgi:diamine N-acetyltransferase
MAGGGPTLNLMGERVALGPFGRDIVPLLHRWGNDPAVRRTFDFPDHWTLEAATAEFARLIAAEHEVFFALHERRGISGADRCPIGFTYLTNVDSRHRTAEFGIMIGAADARGKGYGTEATRLMLDYAFAALGLHNVMLRVASYNRAGIRAYEKAGFREFARRRECRLVGGRWWDEVLMECISSPPAPSPSPHGRYTNYDPEGDGEGGCIG